MYRGEGVAGSGLTDYDVRRCVNAINLQKLLFISLVPIPSIPLHAFFFRTLLSSFSFPYVSPSPLSSQPLPFSGSPLRFCFVSGRPFIEDRTYFKNIKSVRSLLERHCFVCSLISSSNHPYQVSFSSFFIMIFKSFFFQGEFIRRKNINRNIFFYFVCYHDVTSSSRSFQFEEILVGIGIPRIERADRIMLLAAWDWGRFGGGYSFMIHGRASRPVYIFDRVEERPSKLPSNFGRLANRCLNIHGGILMRHFDCCAKHIQGFSTWNRGQAR